MNRIFTSVTCLVLLFTVAPPARAVDHPDWRGFSPMFEIRDVVEVGEYVYGVTQGGFFRFDPANDAYEVYYKNRGLRSNATTCLAATSGAVYIGFEEDGLWRYDLESEEFSQILFPEYHIRTTENPNGIALHDIFAASDSLLYVAHAHGIDVLDLDKRELRTYADLGPDFSTGVPVNAVSVFDGKIWACTPLGLAVADSDNPNLEFGENWSDYTYKMQGITSIVRIPNNGDDPEIYLGTSNQGIARFFPDTGSILSTPAYTGRLYGFTEAMGTWWAASENGLYQYSGTSWMLIDATLKFNMNLVAPSSGDRLWVGTLHDGLYEYREGEFSAMPLPSNLKSETVTDIAVSFNDVVWCATAENDADLNLTFQRYEDGVWTAYEAGDWTPRSVAVMVDDANRVWIGTWGRDGLYILGDDGTPAIENDTVEIVDPEQDIIRPTIAEYFTICTDIQMDRHGNIWVANYQEDQPLHALEAVPRSGAVVIDGYPVTEYRQYSPAFDGLPTAKLTALCTDRNGWVWLGTENKGVTGLFVGNDPFDKSDARVVPLTLAEGMHAMRIADVARDRLGRIWVGSEGGINILTASGLEVEVDDGNDLLGTASREINAIEIDDNDVKWLATAGGLVKLDENDELEAVYTEDNSGLFSDMVLSLAYDEDDDLLWIGTDRGVNLLDTLGSHVRTASRDMHVYPNPFEIWGYDSTVTFTNLRAGSGVDVYSFAGELVVHIEPEHPGDTSITWDGRNYRNAYVASGVYFFVGTNRAGTTFRDKMVVIRR